MRLAVKIGGAALDDHELVSKFAKTIPDLCREGHKLVIVNGGGADAVMRTLILQERRMGAVHPAEPHFVLTWNPIARSGNLIPVNFWSS